MPRLHYADCPYSRKFDEIDVANTISDTMEYLLAIASACKHISVAFTHQEGISNVICSTGRPLCPSFTDMDQLATVGTRQAIFYAISTNLHRTSDTDTPLHVPIPSHESLSRLVHIYVLQNLVFCTNLGLTHKHAHFSDDLNLHSSTNIYLTFTLNISFFSS